MARGKYAGASNAVKQATTSGRSRHFAFGARLCRFDQPQHLHAGRIILRVPALRLVLLAAPELRGGGRTQPRSAE